MKVFTKNGSDAFTFDFADNWRYRALPTPSSRLEEIRFSCGFQTHIRPLAIHVEVVQCNFDILILLTVVV